MTTLEKIRAEIADNHDYYFFAESNKDIALGLEYALEIIDRYAEQEPMREFTAEETKAYSKALDKMYKPTGFNVFNEPCDDAVSRQAVLKMAYDMSEIDGEHFTEPHMVVDVEDIQRLPSVTQKPIECDDVVSRQAVLNIVRGCNNALEEPRIFDCHNSGVVFEKYINELQSVRPQEQTGHWIDADGDNAICGCCNRLNHLYGEYCKHCGARMVEPQESEEVVK